MMDRALEERHLCEADRHIAAAEKNVSNQMILVEKLQRDGHDTKLAEATLVGFEKALEALRGHRNEIVKMIEQIDRGLA